MFLDFSRIDFLLRIRYEATSSNEKGAKYPRKLIHELFIAVPASVFLGLATLFILLWTGIYV